MYLRDFCQSGLITEKPTTRCPHMFRVLDRQFVLVCLFTIHLSEWKIYKNVFIIANYIVLQSKIIFNF